MCLRMFRESNFVVCLVIMHLTGMSSGRVFMVNLVRDA